MQICDWFIRVQFTSSEKCPYQARQHQQYLTTQLGAFGLL